MRENAARQHATMFNSLLTRWTRCSPHKNKNGEYLSTRTVVGVKSMRLSVKHLL